MLEENSAIDRVAMMYKRHPEILEQHVRERNEMAEKLNERTINVIKVSPMYGKLDENGHEYDFDVTTKEILNQIKDDNDNLLRKSFPDLYVLVDEHEKEN